MATTVAVLEGGIGKDGGAGALLCAFIPDGVRVGSF